MYYKKNEIRLSSKLSIEEVNFFENFADKIYENQMKGIGGDHIGAFWIGSEYYSKKFNYHGKFSFELEKELFKYLYSRAIHEQKIFIGHQKDEWGEKLLKTGKYKQHPKLKNYVICKLSPDQIVDDILVTIPEHANSYDDLSIEAWHLTAPHNFMWYDKDKNLVIDTYGFQNLPESRKLTKDELDNQ